MKYKNKLMDIEALQLTDKDVKDLNKLPPNIFYRLNRENPIFFIKTNDGFREINLGDYIITNINGISKPISKLEFDMIYEKI